MAVCRTCGQENPEIARFCLACAAPLAAQTRGRPGSAQDDHRRLLRPGRLDRARRAARPGVASRVVMDRYFDEMSAILERHGGTVEKFIGDAVMAVFGIPVVHEDDALRAVRAAAEMRDALVPLNDELERERGVRIQVRVGVNTGEVVAGDPAPAGRGSRRAMPSTSPRGSSKRRRPGEILLGDEHATASCGTPSRSSPSSRSPSRARRRPCAAVRLLDRPGCRGPPARTRRSSDATTSSSCSTERSTGSCDDASMPRSSPCSEPRASVSRGSSRSSSPAVGRGDDPAGPLPLLRRGHHLLADQERGHRGGRALRAKSRREAARAKIRAARRGRATMQT